MMVLLANLPWRRFGATGVRAGSRWPHLKGPTETHYLPFPFFLAYATALLRKHGFQAVLVDAIAEGLSYDDFYAKALALKPDLLVCETSTVTLAHDLRFLRRFRGMPLALCGPDVNIRSREFMENNPGVTYVLAGEYEFTLLDLVTRLTEGRTLQGAQGLIYRDAGTRINPPRPLCDLDDLPWPLREGLPMERYNDTPGDMPIPSVQMLSSRGCPFRCKFCLWPQVMYQSNRYRARDTGDVAEEMEFLVRGMGFKSVYFDDDTFNCGRERVLRFCEEIKARALDVPWAIMARADLMDEELLERMRATGLFAVKYGVESARQELLDGIDKDMDIARAVKIIRFTRKLGIRTHLTFTFGLPGETRESIRQTIELAMSLDPATLQFSIATPFPGTAFYEEAKSRGYLRTDNWEEFDGNRRCVIGSGSVTPRGLERAVRDAYSSWSRYCVARDPFRKSHVSRFAASLRREGPALALVRAARYCARQAGARFRWWRAERLPALSENGPVLTAGRLTLKPEDEGISIFWEKRRLSGKPGFRSFFTGESPGSPSGWELAQPDGKRLTLRRLHADSSLEEWNIAIVDEKQLDWEIILSDCRRAADFNACLLMSRAYRTWVDGWGEGPLYPLDNPAPVALRNPRSGFIGFRGMRRVRGQTPTVFMELGARGCVPSIRNIPQAGRALCVAPGEGRAGDRGLRLQMRVKIIEEDFRRRSRRRAR